MWTATILNSIFFASSSDPLYVKKRKELSTAFFKSKLLQITEVVKLISLEEVKKVQE